MNEYFKIGKLAASFGLKGELVLKHSLGKKTSLKGLETIFLEDRKDNFMPYFIEAASVKNDTEVFIKLEGIDSKETARKLTPKEVWLTAEDFKIFAAGSAPIAMLGFHLINDDDEDLGEIIEVIEQPHQILCRIELNKKEAYIPLHEETIRKIDKKKQQVIVSLPPGLLEIYQ